LFAVQTADWFAAHKHLDPPPGCSGSISEITIATATTMHSLRNIVALAALSLGPFASAQQYVLKETLDKSNFFNAFEFFNGADPTHGFVNYLSKSDATAKLLAGSIQDKEVVYLGADSQGANVQHPGRESTRVESKSRYTYGLFIADIEHMPSGCGVWPAYWMFGDPWPTKGEIDIIEGVNSQTKNAITLHTSPGCSMTSDGAAEGTTMTTPNCNANEGKDGCSQRTPMPFGRAFNELGGGVIALEWTSSTIQAWWFARTAIPGDVTAGTPDPTTWGAPTAKFNGGQECDISQSYKDHKIIFNIDFCGDWAGKVWAEDKECSALAPTCEEYVAKNPDAFIGAYWSINYLKVFNQAGPGKRDNAKMMSFTA
jgi:hypothetical protein